MTSKIVFLVSGNGGTLKFLNYAIKKYSLDFVISKVIADRDCGAINYARKNNIPSKLIQYNKDYNKELIEELNNCDINLIITNIHKIIDNETLQLYKDKFINLHYSLLPKYAGLIGMKTVDEAKKNNEKYIGATCHIVNEVLDGGDILTQEKFEVNWDENLYLIYDKLFRIACIAFINGIVKKCNLHVPLFSLNNFDEIFWEKIKN